MTQILETLAEAALMYQGRHGGEEQLQPEEHQHLE